MELFANVDARGKIPPEDMRIEELCAMGKYPQALKDIQKRLKKTKTPSDRLLLNKAMIGFEIGGEATVVAFDELRQVIRNEAALNDFDILHYVDEKANDPNAPDDIPDLVIDMWRRAAKANASDEKFISSMFLHRMRSERYDAAKEVSSPLIRKRNEAPELT